MTDQPYRDIVARQVTYCCAWHLASRRQGKGHIKGDHRLSPNQSESYSLLKSRLSFKWNLQNQRTRELISARNT